jgi:hypothetical protein
VRVVEADNEVHHHVNSDWLAGAGVLSDAALRGAMTEGQLFCRSIIKCARDAVGKCADRNHVSRTLWRSAFACKALAAAAMACCVSRLLYLELHES